MRKFVFKLFWFVLPLLVIAYPLDLFISYNFKKSDENFGEFQVWNDIYEGQANCDIAIYGSSRAVQHINPKILEDTLHKSVYDFGILGNTFWLQYLRHLEFIKYNRKPKQIIISLDTYTLNIRLPKIYGASQFLPYLLFNDNIQSYTSAAAGYTDNGFTLLDCYLPLFRYIGKRETLLKSVENIFKNEKDIYKFRNKGFFSWDTEWDEELDARIYKRVQHQAVFEKKSVDLFEEFIQECQNSNIEIILVFSPEFIDFQKRITNRKEVVDFYKEVAIKHDLLFLDYSDDELSYQKEFFLDSLHLNTKGSGIFNNKLAAKLKELGY